VANEADNSSNLRELYLENDNLTSIIPDEVGNFVNRLYLENNELNSVLDEVGNLIESQIMNRDIKNILRFTDILQQN
jgi:Leucine-rich repeat (LRR) protein